METAEQKNKPAPKWYQYVYAFLAGVFLMNMVPHFINGVTGNHFPTPFADPPGKGLSPPMVNILWSTINIVIGFLFLRLAKVSRSEKWLRILVFLGSVFMAFYLASYFGSLVPVHL